MVANLAIAASCGPGAPACMALGSAALAGAAGGDLGDMLRAGAIAYASAVATQAIGQEFGNPAHLGKTVAHGTVGGAISVASGGSFKHGFLAAGTTSLASPAIGMIKGKGLGARTARIAAAAAVGGTASKLGGGKFANGARTAAYLQGFGEAADYYRRRTGYEADPMPGKNRTPNDYPVDPVTHQRPVEFEDQNIVGWNEPLKDGEFFGNFFKHGGFGSRVLNLVFGSNATAGLHDPWTESLTASMGSNYNQIVNFGTMLPAAAISYGAIVGRVVPGDWMTRPAYLDYISRRRN